MSEEEIIFKRNTLTTAVFTILCLTLAQETPAYIFMATEIKGAILT